MPNDIDVKTGEKVSDTLMKKHPDSRCLDLLDMQVTEDVVEDIAKYISGASGPSGLDSISLSY